MLSRTYSRHGRLLCGAAAIAMVAGAAHAQGELRFDIAPQPLSTALAQFGVQSQQAVFADSALTRAKVSSGVAGEVAPEAALARLLEGTGLVWRKEGGGYVIVQAGEGGSGPQARSGGNAVEALIVTAQKREEDIQDVPIAISAFSQEDLTRSQVAGGPDLMTQVPNMTFTKTNFSSYSIQIRGIGTQAISATTDPAVAVAFNNTPFVRNHFFEQEFYDLERVEVLRGPQGTLYGRNATAGVVNVISAKPKFTYEAKASADAANYNSTRLEAMLNVPLVENTVALRLAGAWTKREGFVQNEVTGNPIDGRDLWSTRATLRFAPNDRIDANLIWEHFEENDDRLRSGKQLCHKDVVTEFFVPGDNGFFSDTGAPDRLYPIEGNVPIPDYGQGGGGVANAQSIFSQGCSPASLYSPDSFETPNGASVPYASILLGREIDPYLSETQSRDLRVIESTVDPAYKAKSDSVEFQVNVDLTDALRLTSETAWAHDFIFSTQDFNRFSTAPGMFGPNQGPGFFEDGPNGAVFCDPQIGCADRLVAVDLSTAKSDHFSQEFRLGSDFEGPFNFSLGANFLRYDTEDKYYVFINTLSMTAARSAGEYGLLRPYVPGVTDNRDCLKDGPRPPDYNRVYTVFKCTYMDPNPIGSLNDQGHNYFLSKNPYKLISYAVFGEAYYNLADNLKVTAGLRWTVDKKEAPNIPSWVLGSLTLGYSVNEVIEQEWREPTGRIALDWKPDLSFTDETLIYGSFAHGYKAGGANPPLYGVIMFSGDDEFQQSFLNQQATHPKTFDPEFVNAYELGAKNTLLDGRLTLNLAAFYYDYTGYQISQIVDRSALNTNFDAKVWGLELESDWRPLDNLRLGLKLGYENTQVADGERAIDIMDRTAGHEGWTTVRPFPTFPSNCILPTSLYAPPGGAFNGGTFWGLGGPNGGNNGGCEIAYVLGFDPATEQPYSDTPNFSTHGAGQFWSDLARSQYLGFNPFDPEINFGQGFYKDLSGNELPNAPHYTATLTMDYTVPLPSNWLMTRHSDLYYQSEAWTRIFNTEGYDKLKAYTNVNLAAIFTNEDAGWKVMAYVKNVFDRDSITGAFLNSDDTGLTTNVFLTEPRLYGLRVTKEFIGGPWWTGADPAAKGPFPLTVELGGMIQRQDAPYDPLRPVFMGGFSQTLDTVDSVQNRDLDWGDGRDVRLTYRPSGSPWTVSAGYRFGKTNATDKALTFEFGDQGCGGTYAQCQQGIEMGYTGPPNIFTVDNYSDVTVNSREEHHIADFDVGRDVGLGMPLESSLRAGLRYAEFQSTTHLLLFGVPNWDLPEQRAIFKYADNNHYHADLSASREFEGFGPTLSWDAAKRLWGTDDGHLDLDWSVTGGVLFGKQKTAFEGEETSTYYAGKYLFTGGPAKNIKPRAPTEVLTDLPVTRTKSVTSPLVDLSLGLSYETGRLKVGTGYRWERYFDVLDAGYREHQAADRTLDGPYFKLAIGFGG